MFRNSSFIIVLLISLLVVGCSEEDLQTSTPVAVPVRAIVAGTSNAQLTKTFTGTLEGERQATVYARLAEPVTEILVDEGDRVKKDEVLLELDPHGPSSHYDQTRSVFLNSEKNYKKMEYLYSEGAVSELDFDAAQTRYNVDKAAFESVEKLVRLQSPITGRVTSVKVSPGDYVTVGQELVTVASVDRLRVKFDVNESDLASFMVGTPVTVFSETADATGTGKVVSVASSANPATRGFQIEALMDNSKGQFRPGMFVRIEVTQAELSDVVLAPRESVMTIDGSPVVFKVVQGRAVEQKVTLGTDLSGQIVIDSGLQPGDTLVVLGQNFLSDSALVSVTMADGQ